MKTLLTALAVIFLFLSTTTLASAEAVSGSPEISTETPVKTPQIDSKPDIRPSKVRPHIVGYHTHKPPRVVRKKVRFVPNATPSPRQVVRIAKLEQERWGGPSIVDRMYCESGLIYNNGNGTYHGLLGIGPWWSYVWPKTPKRVVVKTERVKRKPIIRYAKWSGGNVTKKIVRMRKVTVKVKRVGRLPKNASVFHGWGQIRVGQRAVSGDGPTASWECGL